MKNCIEVNHLIVVVTVVVHQPHLPLITHLFSANMLPKMPDFLLPSLDYFKTFIFLLFVIDMLN